MPVAARHQMTVADKMPIRAGKTRVLSAQQKEQTMKFLRLMLLLGGMSAAVMAQGDGSAQVPEINGSSAATTLVLISGAIAVIRSKRTKR